MRRDADVIQMLKNKFRDAVVQHAFAVENGMFLGVERSGIVFEMLNKSSRLRTLVKGRRLPSSNARRRPVHDGWPLFEEIHKG